MEFLKIVWIQWRLYCKDIKTLSALFLTPPLVMLFFEFLGAVISPNPDFFALVNQDQGMLATQLVETLEIEFIKVHEEEIALEKLKSDEVVGFFIIEEDFSTLIEEGQVPKVQMYQLANRDFRNFERQVEKFIQEQLRKTILTQHGLTQESHPIELELIQDETTAFFRVDGLAVIMIIMFIMFHCSQIAREFLALKNSQVLKRLTTTKQDRFTILSSFCVSFFLIHMAAVVFNSLIFKFILNFDLGRFINLLLITSLISIFTICQSIVMARLIKNVHAIDWSAMVIGLTLIGLGIVTNDGSMIHVELPEAVRLLAQFSPFYWVMEMIFFENLFPGVTVILLLSLALLTAGSLKRDQFLK